MTAKGGRSETELGTATLRGFAGRNAEKRARHAAEMQSSTVHHSVVVLKDGSMAGRGGALVVGGHEDHVLYGAVGTWMRESEARRRGLV
jgi:hypothetical protein